jgi:type VI secretion system secreted protein Hcp
VADRWFLKIDGVDGESMDATHKNEIDVVAWSWGVTGGASAGGSAGGAGAGAGRAHFDDFHFVAKISKASPQLILAAASGTHFKWAALAGVRPTGQGKGAEYLRYKLSDVLVTSVNESATEPDVPVEQFSLGYSKFEIAYNPQSAKGTLGTPITAGWDLKANKKI